MEDEEPSNNINNIEHEDPSNNIIGLEYLYNEIYKGTCGYGLHITSLISFFGARHIISDFYDHRQDLLCNPLVKIAILFSILYMNIKNLKLTIIMFFFYVFFIDNYIYESCNKEYIQNEQQDIQKK